MDEETPGHLADPSHHESSAAGIWTVKHLIEHLRAYLSDATALVCVGNELSGDDGAGPAVAQALAGNVPWTIYDVQTVPESFLMKIAAAKPDTVILIDALHFDAEPGAVELLETERLTGQGPSTHGPAPLAFLDVLKMVHDCRQVVLGIQPAQVGFGKPMSPPVKDAVQRVVQAFLSLSQ